MQSNVYIRILDQLVTQMKVAELLEFLSPIVRFGNSMKITDEHRTAFSELVFQSKTGYSFLLQSPEHTSVLNSIGIPQAYQSHILSRMLTALNSTNEASGIWNQSNNFTIFQSFISSLSAIQTFRNSLHKHILEPRVASVSEAQRVLELEIVDYDSTGVSPQRIISALDSLQKLHDAIAELAEQKEARLSVSFIDSGSDILLAVQSTIKVIEIAQSFFKQYWQKIRFKNYDNFDRKMDSMAKGLGIIELIDNNKGLDPESNRRLKHAVLSEMTSLIGYGVALKQVEVDERVDRRRLLAEKRDIKLIEGKRDN